MLHLPIGASRRDLRTLLCLGAHCDDIEIGCGGTVLRLAEAYPELQVHWVVLSSTPERAAEARESAARFLQQVRHKNVIIRDFQTSYFPFIGKHIKDFFESLKDSIAPDLVLTHTRYDCHQDHRTLCELTWNTFRNHLILEYEIPKYDGDLGAPNCFIPLDRKHSQTKVDHLLRYFPSQRQKAWFTRETFLGLLRLRGAECSAPGGHAEAFYCRKAMLMATS